MLKNKSARMVWLSIGILLMASAANGQTTEPPNGIPLHRLRINKIEEKLAKSMSDISFSDVPFAQVANTFFELLECDIILDQSAIDDSLTPETLINFSPKNMTVEETLSTLLYPHNSTFVVDERGVLIISADAASDPEFFRTKIFDCRKLLSRLPEPEAMTVRLFGPGGSFGSGGQGGGGMGGGGLGGAFHLDPQAQVPNIQNPVPAKQESPIKIQLSKSEHFKGLIQKTVSPDSWASTQGEGQMDFAGGFLVVSQSRKNLNDVGKLLADLEYEISKE